MRPIPYGKIALMCIVWSVLLLLGIKPTFNLPFALALIGTVLYLLF